MTREHLPQRRPHETVQFEHWGLTYVVGLGRVAEHDRVREIFINCGKAGTQTETLARDSAVLVSIALQYGVPIAEMRHAITRNVDGSASGPIGALLDLIAKDEREAVAA